MEDDVIITECGLFLDWVRCTKGLVLCHPVNRQAGGVDYAPSWATTASLLKEFEEKHARRDT